MHATFPFTLFQRRRSARTRWPALLRWPARSHWGRHPATPGRRPGPTRPTATTPTTPPSPTCCAISPAASACRWSCRPWWMARSMAGSTARTPRNSWTAWPASTAWTWFTHAGTLFVSRTTEMSTRSITAGGGSIAAVRQVVTSLGVLDTRFGWGELPEQGVMRADLGAARLCGAGGADHGVAAADGRCSSRSRKSSGSSTPRWTTVPFSTATARSPRQGWRRCCATSSTAAAARPG